MAIEFGPSKYAGSWQVDQCYIYPGKAGSAVSYVHTAYHKVGSTYWKWAAASTGSVTNNVEDVVQIDGEDSNLPSWTSIRHAIYANVNGVPSAPFRIQYSWKEYGKGGA
jgi:hypothetical protein